MSTITYKQIITYFSSIAFHHEQIKSFGFGDLKQLTNDVITKQEPQYVRMYIVPENVEFNQNHIHYNYNVIIMDKLEDDLSNQREVMSDTLAIAMDVWTVFWQSYQAQYGDFSEIIVGDWEPQVQPWLENFETVLCGWTLHIKMSAPFDYNSCNLPLNPNYSFSQDQSFSSWEQIVQDWENFSNAHEQIRSFGVGDIKQLTNDVITKKEPLYPRIYFVPDMARFNPNHMHITWKVIICDIVNSDLSNQQEVWSDTLEIAKDFYAKAYLSDYDVEWDANLDPWFEETETGLAGWTLTISVQQKFDYNRCVLPVSLFNTFRTPVWITYSNNSDSLELTKLDLCGKTWFPGDNPDAAGSVLGYIDESQLPIGQNITIYKTPDVSDSTRQTFDVNFLPYVGITLPTGGTQNPDNYVENIVYINSYSNIQNWYSCQAQPTVTPTVTPTPTQTFIPTPTPTPTNNVPLVNCNNLVYLDISNTGTLRYFSCLLNDYVDTVINSTGEYIIEECCVLQSIIGIDGLTFSITNNGIDCSGKWKDQGITYQFPLVVWGTFDPIIPTPTPSPSVTPTLTVTPSHSPTPTPTITPSATLNINAPMYRLKYVTSKINPSQQSYSIGVHGSFNNNDNYLSFNYPNYNTTLAGPVDSPSGTTTSYTEYVPIQFSGQNIILDVYETLTRVELIPSTSSTSRSCKVYVNNSLITEEDFNTNIKLSYNPLNQNFENLSPITIYNGDLITIEINNIFT